ncbi:MAG: TRAP transporter small permease [Bacteroidota bacterium]
MSRFWKRVLSIGTLLSASCLIGSVLLQVFARFALSSTPAWTEAASRVFFLYSVAFAAGLAYAEDGFVALDVWYRRFSPRIQRFLRSLGSLLTLGLFATVAIFSLRFLQLGHEEFSPSMGLRMSVIFFSVCLLAASVAGLAGKDLWNDFNANK